MKKYLVFGAIIIIAGVVVNYSLGGFKPIVPGLVSSNGVTLYGWHYEGRYSSETVDKHIETLQDILNNTDQEGVLTIVNYIKPDLKNEVSFNNLLALNGLIRMAGIIMILTR